MLSDSLNFGKRQELAATVNNQYHYYRNAEEEAKIKEENMRFRLWLYIIIGGTVVLVLLFSLFYMKKKNEHLKEALRFKEEKKQVILQLHKVELEESAEDIVYAIKKASEGKQTLTEVEWRRFFHAVDELQPDLAQKMSEHLGRFSEQQQQVCYLMSVGLSNKQIENLTGLSHTTTWRWTKKMDWLGK